MEIKKYCKFLTAIILSILICFMSVCSYFMSIKAESYSYEYRVYNAQTAKCLYNRTYTLNSLPITDNNPIGISTMSNDRYVDWSKSGVVKIITEEMKNNEDWGYSGTGFVVSPHVIATAAHVVKKLQSDYTIQQINSIYLFDNKGNKTLEATPVECHVPTNYFVYDSYDYALITVKEDLSEYACFDLGVPVESIIDNTEIKVTGFPQKVNGVKVNSLTEHVKYSGTGKITKFFNKSTSSIERMHYYVNGKTFSGDSGCPIYVETDYKDGEKYCTVVGIHNKGAGSTNYATRMSLDVMRFYINNNNLNW